MSVPWAGSTQEFADLLTALGALAEAAARLGTLLLAWLTALLAPVWQWLTAFVADTLAHILSMPLRETIGVTALALLVERLVGWPAPLQRAIGHPVEWIGGMIGELEARLNRHEVLSAAGLKLRGLATVLFVLAFWVLVALLTVLLLRLVLPDPWHRVGEALPAGVFLAQKSLRDHVRDVLAALRRTPEDPAPARRAVGRIVGRDTAEMDESGVVRAAVESLAENTSDGIVAPAFWLALFGLPGIVAYKVINTADSMIGHRDPHLVHFGWAAARLDDLFNLLPARLSGLLYATAAALTSPPAGARALHAMWRDAGRHVSPNAGWPEAALAGALDIALGGPRSYRGRVVDLPWMGDGRRELAAGDIAAALALYGRMLTMTLVLAFVLWLYLPG